MTIPLTGPSRQKRHDAFRDGVIDLLRTRTRKQIVAEALRRFKNIKDEPDPMVRRYKWCMLQLHSAAELQEIIERRLDGLGRLPEPEEKDVASGLSGHWTIQEANLWEAIAGGIADGHATGGGWGSADDVEWGEDYWDYSTDDIEDAQNMAEALDQAGVPNTGVYPGSDGNYHVAYDAYGSD
jgi:hypothetical protein